MRTDGSARFRPRPAPNDSVQRALMCDVGHGVPCVAVRPPRGLGRCRAALDRRAPEQALSETAPARSRTAGTRTGAGNTPVTVGEPRSRSTRRDRGGIVRERASRERLGSVRCLLKHPSVAVRVAERRIRAITAALRIRAADSPLIRAAVEYLARVVEYPAHLYTPGEKLFVGLHDVGNDEVESLRRTGSGSGDPD